MWILIFEPNRIENKTSVRKTLITILDGYRGHKNVLINDLMHSVFKHTCDFFMYISLWLECFGAISADFSQEMWFVMLAFYFYWVLLDI